MCFVFGCEEFLMDFFRCSRTFFRSLWTVWMPRSSFRGRIIRRTVWRRVCYSWPTAPTFSLMKPPWRQEPCNRQVPKISASHLTYVCIWFHYVTVYCYCLGVANMDALKQVVASQRLYYDFDYNYNLPFDTNIRLLIISEGKTIVEVWGKMLKAVNSTKNITNCYLLGPLCLSNERRSRSFIRIDWARDDVTALSTHSSSFESISSFLGSCVSSTSQRRLRRRPERTKFLW